MVFQKFLVLATAEVHYRANVRYGLLASGINVWQLQCPVQLQKNVPVLEPSSCWLAMPSVSEQRRGIQLGGVRSTSQVANSFIGTGFPPYLGRSTKHSSTGAQLYTLYYTVPVR